ncbi:hypothetical protein PG985_000198 [Apiospora marii]|uniref:uncharacterized protein n=1 Tax=Apiospora marii TaxID=335849 RepID=UPI00312E9045
MVDDGIARVGFAVNRGNMHHVIPERRFLREQTVALPPQLPAGDNSGEAANRGGADCDDNEEEEEIQLLLGPAHQVRLRPTRDGQAYGRAPKVDSFKAGNFHGNTAVLFNSMRKVGT